MYEQALQRRYYDAFDRELNATNAFFYLEKRWRLVSEHVAAGRMLDVGCGAGLVAHHFEGKGWRCVGSDLSWRRMMSAPDTEVIFVQCRAESLPFVNEAFDLVVANALLHHVQGREAVLQEMVRVTRENGGLLIVEPSRFHPLIVLQAASNRAEWGVFSTNRKRIVQFLAAHPRVAKLELGGLVDFLYPYRTWPPSSFCGLVRRLEDMIVHVGCYTHFFVRCKIS